MQSLRAPKKSILARILAESRRRSGGPASLARLLARVPSCASPRERLEVVPQERGGNRCEGRRNSDYLLREAEGGQRSSSG